MCNRFLPQYHQPNFAPPRFNHRRTGRYEPKGKVYPELPARLANETHQVDLIGPCYLTGPIRFYSLNSIDTAINRCGIEPMPSQAAQSVLDAVYAVWKRMGIPDNLQVDNEMAFFGSPDPSPRMGPLIRLCLLYGVNLWFIPPAEPWRNGVVEKFNDHNRQKFLAKITNDLDGSIAAGISGLTNINTTALIDTASSRDKRPLRPWLVGGGSWFSRSPKRHPGIPWRNRKKDAIIWSDSFGMIVG